MDMLHLINEFYGSSKHCLGLGQPADGKGSCEHIPGTLLGRIEYGTHVRNMVAAIMTMSKKMLKDDALSGMNNEIDLHVKAWHSLSQQIKCVPKTLTEISSWFSPMLYNQKIVGRKWKMSAPGPWLTTLLH
ncbi:hypothetical protein L210DRAFT_3509846 [Boletus edulis BED1]|uniref:Uncharacterized protein n=1 Tax=Boletus edulis BED1 TaxID=1328754 RepID=A0AAD4BDM3_BOLED|nr:hypothetical protein L210DRAFT_3509846 [Boletus edulis BED1]